MQTNILTCYPTIYPTIY